MSATVKPPVCLNPHCPRRGSVMTYIGATANNEGHTFLCKPCWDIAKQQSIRVVTDPRFSQMIREKRITSDPNYATRVAEFNRNKKTTLEKTADGKGFRYVRN